MYVNVPERTHEENMARAAALMSHLHGLKGTLGGVGTSAWRAPDPIETAKSLYISGAISVEAFEAQLDVALHLV